MNPSKRRGETGYYVFPHRAPVGSRQDYLTSDTTFRSLSVSLPQIPIPVSPSKAESVSGTGKGVNCTEPLKCYDQSRPKGIQFIIYNVIFN
ncbi:hypothetical protein J6590_099347 [Homalodisca vitripennis]|nr:hypothetical protein J6590_099347 [Homalodisca vitripennis]